MTKILVVGPAWVGDMVMAHSLFQVIKHDQVDSQIHVLAPPWSSGVLMRMPEVTDIISMPLKHNQLGLHWRWKIAQQQRKKQFDQAIVLPNSLKSALLPAMAKIPIRSGYLGEKRYGLLNDIRRLDKSHMPLQVHQFANLGVPKGGVLSQAPQPALCVNQTSKTKILAKFGLSLDKPILVLCPGSQYGEAKRWPAKYFATVAKAMVTQGWQVWLLGSSEDALISAEINQLSNGQCQNLCAAMRLYEAVDVMSCATAVVTNDSGLMHVAAALQCQVIALFGSSSEQHTPPLSEKSKVLSLPLDCRPCFSRSCPLGHLDCLNKLYPEKVIGLLSQ